MAPIRAARVALAAAAVLLAASTLAACGPDCEAYCDKMDDCNGENFDCDTSQCVEFCEQAVEIDAYGFSASAECAIETSCDDLKAGACFPWNDAGVGFCGNGRNR